MSIRRMMVASEAVEPEEWRGSNVIPKAWKQEETISDGWSKIVENCQNGTYKDKYKIGDTKIADFGVQGLAMMQIVGFDLDPLNDGSRNAYITWASRHTLSEMGSSGFNGDKYLQYLPIALQPYIRTIKKKYPQPKHGRYDESSAKIWALSPFEAGIDLNVSGFLDRAGTAGYVNPPIQPKATGLTPDGLSVNAFLRSGDPNYTSSLTYGEASGTSTGTVNQGSWYYFAPCFALF